MYNTRNLDHCPMSTDGSKTFVNATMYTGITETSVDYPNLLKEDSFLFQHATLKIGNEAIM